MTKILTSILILLLPLHLFSQSKFVEGFCKYNDGTIQRGLLLNGGVENSGDDYYFKTHKDSTAEKIDINHIKEFGVEGQLKYTREFISIDISEDQIKAVSDTLDHADYLSGHVFLKEIVVSEAAALYYFFFEGKEHFFFRTKDSGVNHLVYKKYYISVSLAITSDILIDNRYQEQLSMYLPCSVNTKTLSYTRNSLTEYFLSYLEENGVEGHEYGTPIKSDFSFKLTSSFNRTSFILYDGDVNVMDFGKENDFAFGAELNFLFPFDKHRWGAFAEINYINFQSLYGDSPPGLESHITYTYIDIPFGLMGNINLSEKFKVYLKAGFASKRIFDNSGIYIYRPINSYGLNETSTLFFGMGITYANVSAEARFWSKSDITQNLIGRQSAYEQVSFRLAIRLLHLGDK